jgi:hypothetical protein
VADLPFRLTDPALHARLAAAVDREEKIPRALEALGPVAGQRVVLVEAGPLRTAQLEVLGARVSPVPTLSMEGLPRGLADVVVSMWAGFRGGSGDTEDQVRDVERVVRPGGRLLVVHDYGRDDVSRLRADDERERENVARSRRDGWFLLHDFKVRVLHCWWTFASLEEAHDVLVGAFGPPATAVAASLRRPRLEYKVAVYHRTLGEES